MSDFSGHPFISGAQVEVNFDEEGFRGSWYTATVLRRVSAKSYKKPRLQLQFHTLTDAKTLSIRLARPSISSSSARSRPASRTVGEDLDAFHNDGWWEGVVSPPSTAARGTPSSSEQLVFLAVDLRLHRYCVYGKWVPPLEYNVQLP